MSKIFHLFKTIFPKLQNKNTESVSLFFLR